MKLLVVQLALWAMCWATASISPLWTNEQYLRTIDLRKSYIKETVDIEAKNVGSSASNEYYFTLPDGFGSMDEVIVFSALLDNQAIVEFEALPNKTYKLKLPIPLAPNSKANLKLRYVYTNQLVAVPNELELSKIQTLLLKINKFNYSPYDTKNMTLVLEGMNKVHEMDLVGIDEDTEVPEIELTHNEKSVVFGPVADVKPYSIKALGILYDHNKPLGKVHKLERGIWLPSSDINEFQIEEYYEVYNAGAELKDGFSRVDWMKGKYEAIRNHWGLSHLEFPMSLELEYDDYYFTDKVGMVTTHQKVLNVLLFQPRFPLFGGWKYSFTFGYNQHFDNRLRKVDDETYMLKIPLLSSPIDLTYSTVNVNFYLPENAEFVNVSSPIRFTNVQTDFEKSYLDVSQGHKKVTVTFENLFDDLSKVDIYLQYKYTKANYWFKVLKISGFVFTGLVSYYALNLVNLSIQ